MAKTLFKLSAMFDLMGGDGEALIEWAKKAERQQLIHEGVAQWDPKLHPVADKGKRPDKQIFVPNGEKDENGEDILVEDTAPVARAPMAIQKYIINQKASFARGSGVILRPSREGSTVYDRVQNNWRQNKTDFFLKEIATRMMAETQVAVIFYSPAQSTTAAPSPDDFRLRFKIVSPLKGDKLTPIFDQDTGDLIAFGREYEVHETGRYDLYIMNREGFCEIHRYEGTKGKLSGLIDPKSAVRIDKIITPYTNLPVIYWEQDLPECDDTKELIEEFETAFSDFLTQMGYSADPILFGKGTTLSMPAKGSPGKYVEGSADANLEFVTPANATESRKLQFQMLEKFIFTLNRSVKLDLDTMKELGDVSGAALERYLLEVYLEATDRQQGPYGIGVQRMVNFMLTVWKYIEGTDEDLTIDVEFQRFSVTDVAERVALAMKSNGNKPVVDHETSIAIAGLVDDPAAALRKINEESAPPIQEEEQSSETPAPAEA
jgi:hypothetical protein